jgi:hypothetical protein
MQLAGYRSNAYQLACSVKGNEAAPHLHHDVQEVEVGMAHLLGQAKSGQV